MLHQVATQRFTAKIGEFTFKTIDLALDPVIYWSDGTTSLGTLVGSYATGQYYVEATHTYVHTGTYKVGVKVFAHPVGTPRLATEPVAQFAGVAIVDAPRPTEGGFVLSRTAGQRFTAKLGEFEHRALDLLLEPIVYWSDGTTSIGKLVGSYATGQYYVEATHTYTEAGTYKVGVKVFAHPAGSQIRPEQPIAQFASVVTVTGAS
jgi:hypothetical protein